MIEKYPLKWPDGYERTEKSEASNFKVTADVARKHLVKEIEALSGDSNPIISSNVPVRKSDGMMYSDMANDELDDPGVAVYFMMDGNQVAFACDAFLRPKENLRALGLTIEAMRAQSRYKCSGIMRRQFQGFKALPQTAGASGSGSWWSVLMVDQDAPRPVVEGAYKSLRKYYHPDMATGNEDMFHLVQQAWEEYKKG